MGDKSAIEWTDATWNPIRGCSRVSEGCRNCYAEVVARRFSGPGQPYEGLARAAENGEPRWTGEVRFIEKHLMDPLRWKEPRRIFVNSMSDLFHEKLDQRDIERIFAVMAHARQHTFQVLTKRPLRMLEFMRSAHYDVIDQYRRLPVRRVNVVGRDDSPVPWPPRNVWLGVSAENQATANERIPLLAQTRAAVRFVSAEPLLGPIDFTRIVATLPDLRPYEAGGTSSGMPAPEIKWPPLDWIIAGGESGANARPMHPAWARSIRDQCQRAGLPFFFKQWGEWAPIAPQYPETEADEDAFASMDPLSDWCAVELNGSVPVYGRGRHDYQPAPGSWLMERIGKKRASRELDGRTWDEYPQVKEGAAV